MRRTFIGAAALGCAAVVLGTVPAFADSTTPTTRPAEASPVPATGPTDRASEASPVPSTQPTRATTPTKRPASRDQVSVVPAGAPDTGVTGPAQDSGTPAAAIGGAAATALLAGAGFVVVRRRRATGA
ncbi:MULTISPECIES: twin-arginine translocation signal domain-containing protein [Streptomyces]|jgi:LPXTG-motif cell wall-anchored protein|uniref:Twin-arginine translocation signal domain-containing protein n=1 Tax=Streptomyces doudnae TaxID=3075536 RepID=A0ABD5EK57_9ACTN|nr:MULTISPECIES: twin-arginine translocation signal domain-containing protein [unclassified Streptomyces]MDT0434976.1 twin-arginine translocation signal domain-containing protein [Streptomyces sp. DSM 41981]MYQ64392.1 twin-arginine translocation signal domain-containing protein [Streptomyces sp. SID4950]SCD78150.1 LPXTG-motif cell wall anchor domain-containing protein/Tat (twin-arginine translocation) pathway signal sequence [Streptomyces sp. SolWspMP-5a-2]